MQPLEGRQWKKAKVVDKVGERSYLAQTADGKVYRRIRKYLRTTIEDTDIPTSVTIEPVVPIAGRAVMPDEASKITQDQVTNENQVVTDTVGSNEGTYTDEVLSEQKMTRSGRIIKLPARYRDND